MTADEFIDFMGNTAGMVCANYNLPASVCIAQAAIESGWGRYCIGNYNYFGRKWGGWGNYVEKSTQKYDPESGYYDTTAKFQDYDSLEDAVKDWCVLMTEEPAYSDALDTWHKTWDVEAFVRAMASVYATDPNYADKILSTIRANDLMRFDGWDDE